MDETNNKKIVIVGFMGSGKTHWGKIWSSELGIEHIDLDEQISKIEKLSVSELFKTKGEAYFRKTESEVLNNLLDGPKIILSTGGGTPCFNNNMEHICEKSTCIYLKCKNETLFTRLQIERHSRPLISNLNDNELSSFVDTKIAEREVYYNKANYILDEENLNLSSLKYLINA